MKKPISGEIKLMNRRKKKRCWLWSRHHGSEFLCHNCTSVSHKHYYHTCTVYMHVTLTVFLAYHRNQKIQSGPPLGPEVNRKMGFFGNFQNLIHQFHIYECLQIVQFEKKMNGTEINGPSVQLATTGGDYECRSSKCMDIKSFNKVQLWGMKRSLSKKIMQG